MSKRQCIPWRSIRLLRMPEGCFFALRRNTAVCRMITGSTAHIADSSNTFTRFRIGLAAGDLLYLYTAGIVSVLAVYDFADVYHAETAHDRCFVCIRRAALRCYHLCCTAA